MKASKLGSKPSTAAQSCSICFHHLKNWAVSLFNKKYKNKNDQKWIVYKLYWIYIIILSAAKHCQMLSAHRLSNPQHLSNHRQIARAKPRSVDRYVDPQLVGPRWTDGPMDRWTAPASCQKGFPAHISVLSISTISFTGLVNIWNMIYDIRKS